MKPFADPEITALSAWLEHQQDFVFLETTRVSNTEHRSYLFTEARTWLVCRAGDDAGRFLARAVRWQERGYVLAGWIGYEFGYLLEPALQRLCADIPPGQVVAELGVFRTPLIYDHRTLSWSLDPDVPVAASGRQQYRVSDVCPAISREEYLRAVDDIKKYIRAGDTYQVNYTLKLDFSFQGSVAALYRTLRRNQSVGFGAWLRKNNRDILSFSPELFFRVQGERITVRPMKGTLGRGRTTMEDAEVVRALARDVKNRSENVMIVDLLRNDLGRLLHESGGGQVRVRSLFDVETYETLHQMTSTIEGISTGGHLPGLDRLFRALFPCGSVTGAPKIRTMEIIHELEKKQRGVYCGAIGWAGDGEAVFNVPIRTLVLEDGRGEMGIGSGIVHDSDPEGEWEESLLKSRFLVRPRPDFQLIETMLWEPGQGFWLLDYHLDRLRDSARYHMFVWDPVEIRRALEQDVAGRKVALRVRLLLHRDGRAEVNSAPVSWSRPARPLQVRREDPLPRVLFSRFPVDNRKTEFFHKTTRRELYERERTTAVSQGYFEVLFCNRQGEVTEGTITNVFLELEGELITPAVHCGLLPGTFRRLLLEKGLVREQVIFPEDVVLADAVYVGNSLRGLVQVEVAGQVSW
ncbi:aminodeoxychorismate synthase component I [Desulfolithobacter sp.]